MIDELIEIFSTRELAIIVWTGTFVAVLFILPKMGGSMWKIVRQLFQPVFLKVFAALTIYVLPIAWLFSGYNFWNLKDYLFWLFGVALVLIFRVNKAKDSKYFTDLLLDGLKVTAIFEFIVNSYTFGLLTELILVPLITFVILLQVVSERDEENKQVTSFLKGIIAIVSVFILTLSIYHSIQDRTEFYTIETLLTYLLPVMLTATFLPFIYFMALYMAYETYFVRLDFMYNKKEKIKKVKRYIWTTAGLSINKLHRIMKRLEKRVFFEDIDLKKYIQSISTRK